MGFRILGTGSALPAKILKNDDLKQFIDTSDEWIRTRTGIEERRVLTGEESLLSLAEEAVNKALSDGKIKPREIDAVICTTMQGDCSVPSLSCLLAGKIGAREDVVTLDVNQACCGFVYGLSAAEGYFSSGLAKRALVVSAEAVSRLTDWTDRSTCILFGDAAAAVVLEKSAENKVYFDFCVKPDDEVLSIERPNDNFPYAEYSGGHFIKMDGQEVYKFAGAAIYDRIKGVLGKSGYKAEDVKAFLLHQANIRIINSSLYKLKLTDEKFPHNIERYGNTSSASIPLLLDEELKGGRLNRGDRTVMCAFGAGLMSAACLFEL